MVNLGRLLVVFACVLCVTKLSAQQPDTTFWVPNGPVNSLVLHDSTVILGGDFDIVSPVTGSFVRLDTLTAAVDPNLFKVNGTVYATVMDTAGNIYVGGSFTRAGNTSVNNLFRINTDGTFDHSFVHDVLGTVYCLALHDTDLFIGGEFTNIDGVVRNNFGGISLNTGLVNDCNPDVNGPVYCMEVDLVFMRMMIGGDFTGVGPFQPPYLAKISMETGVVFPGTAVPWTATPNVNGPVYDIQQDGFRVYIAGEFTLFGNIPRVGIAALLNSDGSLLPYDAQVMGAVFEMEFADTSVYIGGSFTSAGGQPRNNIACISRDLVLRAWWNVGANGIVRTIVPLDKTRLFVGGEFTLFGGDTCGRGAILDKATVQPLDWDPNFNGNVYTAICDTFLRLYAAGGFFGAAGVLRNNLCALNVNTGMATAWNPKVNAPVQTMTLDGDTLYLAGDFTSVNATSRGRVAAIDLNSSNLLPFNPVVNGLVRTMAVTDSMVYFGGNFTVLGGQPRNNIGNVVKSNSLATPWNPNCLGTVNSILLDQSWVYVTGYYNTISGVTRENMARLNPVTAVADWNWVCDTDQGIYEAKFYNGSIALGGWFSTVNGQGSPGLAIVDTATLALSPVNFASNGFVTTFATYGDDFFLSGPFSIVNAQYQPRLIAYDEGNSAIDPWTPGPNAPPNCIQATATRLFIGGQMTTTSGLFHPYFQVLNTQWVTGADEVPHTESAFTVYPVPAGDFITIESKKNFASYTITDLTGKIVQAGILETGSSLQTISVVDLSAGMYVLNLATAERESSSRKIVID